MKRIIFHVDVNSAFLSWEAVRRLSEGEEDIRLIPSAIGGDRDKRTGVILAKSIPAKSFGVRTGEPVAAALKKCPSLKVFKPDFALYVKNSHAFMSICEKYSPVVEKYSIDECFMDMTGMEKIFPDIEEAAYKLKDEIKQSLGFTVNVGIGENKLLAKTASDFTKPDKVHTLFLNELKSKLWPLSVGELFSVGWSTAERLTAANIKTVGDLAVADLNKVQRLIGDKPGKQIHDYANGIDFSPVLSEPEDAKCYSVSVTLEKDVIEKEEGEKIILALCDSVSQRMRADKAEAYCIGVTIRFNDFKNKSHQRKLSEPTDVTDEIFNVSKSLFSELWNGIKPIRLIGVSLSDIVRGGAVQRSFFSEGEMNEKAKSRDKVVDYIRDKFGIDAISRGTLIGNPTRVGKKYRAQIEEKRDK